MKNSFFSLVVFSVAFAFFYQIQFSSPSIPGFDGYYHIKIATLIKSEGFSTRFPWLWYTFWRDHFVDIHFLYHALLIPFTYLGLVYGAKMSTVFFFAAMATLFHAALRTVRVPQAWFWTGLLFVASPAFLQRMAFPRAPLAALCFLFLGWLLYAKGKRVGLGILSFLFVWLYGGFTIFLALIFFLIASQLVLEKKLEFQKGLIVLVGVTLGLIVNPYFPENFNFIITQTFTAGLDRVVVGGGEWSPYDLRGLLWTIRGTAWVFAFSFVAFLFAWRKPRPDTMGWALFLVVTFSMTLDSKRFIEYLVPTLIASSALFFRDAWEVWSPKIKISRQWVSIPMIVILLAGLIGVGINQDPIVKSKLMDSRESGRYEGGALWLKEHTPGALVYLTDWDDFPELFFYNDKNKYIVGLDPAFLYEFNPTMYKKWNEINEGVIKEDPYPILKNMFKTPFLFTDARHGGFNRLMDRNPRIALEYRDAYCRIYSLQ